MFQKLSFFSIVLASIKEEKTVKNKEKERKYENEVYRQFLNKYSDLNTERGEGRVEG